jgi:hypothetical protein
MTISIQLKAGGSILHVRATGKLTREDYAQWVPALDAQIEAHGRVNILMEMHDFHGWTAGALWDDLKFGVTHFGSISRIAIVGEKPWQKGMASFCRPFTRARIHYFEASEIDAAQAWLDAERGPEASQTPHDVRDVPAPVAELLNILNGQDGLAREEARAKLVHMGPPITPHLVAAAKGGLTQLRLEATQALAAIADPGTTLVLAGQLDDTLEIGWAAAEGLARLGRDGAVAALQQLVQHPNSHGVRMSAHHALRSMEDLAVREAVAPVASALINSDPITTVTVAAAAAIETLRTP